MFQKLIFSVISKTFQNNLYFNNNSEAALRYSIILRSFSFLLSHSRAFISCCFFLLIVRINCPQALMKCFFFFISFYFVGIPFIYYNMSCCFLKAKKSLLENHSFVSAWQTASNFRFTRSLNHKGHAKIPFLFSPQNSIFLTWILFFFILFLLFSHIFLRMIYWRKQQKKCWKLFYLFRWIKKDEKNMEEAELLPQQH